MSLRYKGQNPVVDCSKDKGFTVQADRSDADINLIIARLEKGANLARLNSKEPFYGDVSHISGLADALIKVQEANDLFNGFDARLRERFDNDPVKFVQFFEDPKNIPEAIELGLALPLPKENQPPVPSPEAGAAILKP